jgi:hypothetical protein
MSRFVLFFARSGASPDSTRARSLPAGGSAGPFRSADAVILSPHGSPASRGARGDREAFQERAARDAVRCARGRVTAAPRRCPVAVERLGVGDWPATADAANSKITDEDWGACVDEASSCLDPVCFAFDVTPDRASASISVAGWRSDGLPHVEVLAARAGTGWVVEAIAKLLAKHRSLAVLFEESSPAASLLADLAERDIVVRPVKAREHSQACGMLYDAVVQRGIRHLGTTELAQAIKGAATRILGDAWAWARKSSTANISPLVTCTLAFWGLKTIEQEPPNEAVG